MLMGASLPILAPLLRCMWASLLRKMACMATLLECCGFYQPATNAHTWSVLQLPVQVPVLYQMNTCDGLARSFFALLRDAGLECREVNMIPPPFFSAFAILVCALGATRDF